MKWEQIKKDLGRKPVGKEIKIIFKSKDSLDIHRLTSSCSCSTPVYNKKNKVLTVYYTPNKIPVHLLSVGEYYTEKKITVEYKDGEKDVLSFKAIIYNA